MTAIAYIGNFKPERSTENAYRYAFERLGCTMRCIDQAEAQRRGGLRDDETAWADLALYTRTHNRTALGAEWTDEWRRLEANGVKTASVHLDVFVGAPDMNDHNHEYIGHGMMHRDGMTGWTDPLFTTGHVFTPDPLLGNYIDTEQTTHHWLPPAADIRHGDAPGEPIAGLEGKVVFVGSDYGTATSHPEYPERHALLGWLAETFADDFVWYGPGSPVGALRGKAIWDVYASDCVIVGDSCFAQSWESRPYYWSDRVPETIAHGGLLTHPSVQGIRERFPLLSTWDVGHDNLEEIIENLRLGFRTGMRQQEARGQAMALARRDHTYLNRAREILRVTGLED